MAIMFLGLALYGLIDHKLACGKWFNYRHLWGIHHESLIAACLIGAIYGLV